jgi:hypothetical protein
MTIEINARGTTIRSAWRSASTAGAFVLAVAMPVDAGMVPGGGPAESDCYAELDVEGVENGTAVMKGNNKVRCVDGDPCDAGACGDGVCDFKVRLCWNQRDPNVEACHPMPALDSLLLRGPLSALMLMPHDLGGSTCSESYTDFSVPTKGNGKRPGRLNVRITAKAPAGTTPLVDNDLIRLVCVPRPFEECRGATSTTTTVAVPTTTIARATTTTPTTSSTTTTRRRPRKTTTTTARATTTTSSTFARPTTIPLPTTTFPIPTTSIPLPTTTLPTVPIPTTSTTDTPTTTPPETTTLGPTTTTPTFEPTTTTRKRKGDGDHDDLVLPLQLP